MHKFACEAEDLHRKSGVPSTRDELQLVRTLVHLGKRIGRVEACLDRESQLRDDQFKSTQSTRRDYERCQKAVDRVSELMSAGTRKKTPVVKQVATEFGVSERLVWEWIAAAEQPGRPFGSAQLEIRKLNEEEALLLSELSRIQRRLSEIDNKRFDVFMRDVSLPELLALSGSKISDDSL
jgi:hypothetical protein